MREEKKAQKRRREEIWTKAPEESRSHFIPTVPNPLDTLPNVEPTTYIGRTTHLGYPDRLAYIPTPLPIINTDPIFLLLLL